MPDISKPSKVIREDVIREFNRIFNPGMPDDGIDWEARDVYDCERKEIVKYGKKRFTFDQFIEVIAHEISKKYKFEWEPK